MSPRTHRRHRTPRPARTVAAYLLAVLAAWSVSAPAQTIHIGRLFTTPAERQRLDAQRVGGGTVTGTPTPAQISEQNAVPPAPPPPPPPPVTLNGVVKRSDGRTTVWINQSPHTDSQIGNAPGTGQPVVAVPLPNGGTVQLKPGQQVDVNTGVVRDASE